MCPSLCLSVCRVVCIAFWQLSALTVITCSAYGCSPRVPHYNLYSITLFPHWDPEDPSGLQLSLYVYVSLCLSVRSSASLFGDHKSAARNFAQIIRPQTTGSNSLIGGITCPSVCLYVRSSVRLLRFLYLYWFPVLESSVAMHLY